MELGTSARRVCDNKMRRPIAPSDAAVIDWIKTPPTRARRKGSQGALHALLGHDPANARKAIAALLPADDPRLTFESIQDAGRPKFFVTGPDRQGRVPFGAPVYGCERAYGSTTESRRVEAGRDGHTKASSDRRSACSTPAKPTGGFYLLMGVVALAGRWRRTDETSGFPSTRWATTLATRCGHHAKS